MIDDVKRCVDMRVNYFDTYFTVPAAVQGEVNDFIRSITALGETCANATEFEAKFNSQGYSARFNSLIPKCTPKPARITKEDRKRFRSNAREIISENKEELLKDAASEAARTATLRAENALYRQNRERMIEEGTFGDYKKARDAAEDISSVAGFFKRHFGKK